MPEPMEVSRVRNVLNWMKIKSQGREDRWAALALSANLEDIQRDLMHFVSLVEVACDEKEGKVELVLEWEKPFDLDDQVLEEDVLHGDPKDAWDDWNCEPLWSLYSMAMNGQLKDSTCTAVIECAAAVAHLSKEFAE